MDLLIINEKIDKKWQNRVEKSLNGNGSINFSHLVVASQRSISPTFYERICSHILLLQKKFKSKLRVQKSFEQNFLYKKADTKCW
jgi:hypothetical protein